MYLTSVISIIQYLGNILFVFFGELWFPYLLMSSIKYRYHSIYIASHNISIKYQHNSSLTRFVFRVENWTMTKRPNVHVRVCIILITYCTDMCIIRSEISNVTPRSGSGMFFFRIPDLESRISNPGLRTNISESLAKTF